MIDSFTAWVLGLALGTRHALEPDHLAAVSTLVTRPTGIRPLGSAMLGAFWGIGHTLALFAVGVVLTVLRTELPPRLGEAFELVVAAMLIFLGVRALLLARREAGEGEATRHVHPPDGVAHTHAGPAAHVHLGRFTLAVRPLVIGIVHGLAGSGALAALAMARLDTGGARVAYIACFGLGSVVGMSILTGLLGIPLARMRPRVLRYVGATAGCISLVLGVLWGAPLIERWLV
ncbi:MAG TPA: hypothetical protein VKE22_09245 [Haliangiales bacterium]|nr:hypothetical protein [Haliangiales bacterium]